MRTLLALGALACLTPLAAADVFHAAGSFAGGTPLAYFVVDACGNGRATDGVDSSCIDLPGEVRGLVFRAEFAGVGLDQSQVCFYDELQFLACFDAADQAARIPPTARAASMCALSSAQVSWTFDV